MPLQIVARGEQSQARAVTIDPRFMTDEEELPHRRTHLMIRMGGFSVTQHGRMVEIPRVRRQGTLVHDQERLESVVDPSRRHTTIRYMGTVEAEALYQALFAPGPSNHSIELLIP